MASVSDPLLSKTDDELRFFANNPQFYQAELVQAARRELQRRGLLEAPPRPAAPVAPGPVQEYLEPAQPPGPTGLRWPGGVAIGAGLAVVGGGLWWYSHGSEVTARVRVAKAIEKQKATDEANKLSPEALKLESVPTYALPTFDVPELVREQLASVPASQKQDADVLRQFRALSKRFWAAETQSEYLANAAYSHQAAPTFAEQAKQARQTWHEWNRAAVYTFKFGPVMSKQLELMRQVGSSQQHILEQLPEKLEDDEFLTDRELNARQTDVQAWMAGLRPTSPVTGKKYKVEVLQYHP